MSLTSQQSVDMEPTTDRADPALVLNSARDVAAFRVRLHALQRLPPAEISLGPTFASLPDHGERERRLNSLYSECGCVVASYAAAVGAVVSAVRLATSGRPIDRSDAVRATAAILSAALLGKSFALARKRAQLIRLTAEMQHFASATMTTG